MTWTTRDTLLALSFLGVGAIAYFLFFKNDDIEENFSYLPNLVTHTIEVPTEMVGTIIGRKGIRIKQVQEKTGCRIDVAKERGTNSTQLTLRGTIEATQLAESLIHEVISTQPLIETFEMKVPSEACGQIIGRNGESIRKISANSNARITIPSAPSNSLERLIKIKGTHEQIRAAQILIEAKISENNDLRQMFKWTRTPRGSPQRFLKASREQADSSQKQKLNEVLVPTCSDGSIEVYVSAIESPDRLWLQIKGQSTVDLDRLIVEMTDYYRRPENRIVYALQHGAVKPSNCQTRNLNPAQCTQTEKECRSRRGGLTVNLSNLLDRVEVGQLVAAPFMFDNKYYRAEVISIHPQVENDSQSDDSIPSNTNIQLYYVDYGDMGSCSVVDAFELRTDFLKLRFQAIEAILAGIKSSSDDGKWSEEAIDWFETLTHVALWKPLTARIDGFRQRPTRGKMKDSPVPCVQLYDHDGHKDITIADALVEKGFAVWDKECLEETSGEINGCNEPVNDIASC